MRVVASLVVVASLGVTRAAWAQGAVRDQSTALTATPNYQSKTNWLQQRFSESFVDLSTYVGSGTFYTSGYHDPYVSNALFLRPTYQLGTKYKLSLNGRAYFEEEFTTPDTLNDRHFYPSDASIYLQAKNLHTFPRSKIGLFGTFRVVIPVSYESRYAHLVTALGVSLGAKRGFELGRPDPQGKRWNLGLSLGTAFTKMFRTSAIRGDSPGDTTGCRAASPEGLATATAGPSETDRCGGPLSTSYTFSTVGTVSLSRSRYSLTVTMSVINEFKYSVDPSIFQSTMDTQFTTLAGRVDSTWGTIGLGYEVNDHLSFSLGVSSFQPALDSTYQHLRFPFFDFSGTNANDFTQAFVGATGTL